MIRVDKTKLEEISANFKRMADSEINALTKKKAEKGEEITEEEKTSINMKYANQQINTLAKIMLMSPKRLYETGLGTNHNSGWREGFTRPTIEARRERNRKRQKAAKIAKRANRNK